MPASRILFVLNLLLGTWLWSQNTESIQPPKIDGTNFRLVIWGSGSYFATSDVPKCQVRIPKPWLLSPQEEMEEEGHVVSTAKFSSSIHSFAIGGGLIGLHLSSFDAMKPGSGSLNAAAGKDVFLIFDPQNKMLSPGLIDLGVTKSRVRSAGRFEATSSHFVLGDVNADGMMDLGVVREEIKGQYRQHPVAWYVYEDGTWNYRREFRRHLNLRYRELPLIEIQSLPVDFVGSVRWHTHDCRYWRDPPQTPEFIPAYRRELVNQEKQKEKQ